MATARVHYEQDGHERFIRGLLLEENQDYIKIEIDRYIVSLNRKIILKLEVDR